MLLKINTNTHVNINNYTHSHTTITNTNWKNKTLHTYRRHAKTYMFTAAHNNTMKGV